MDIKHEGQWCLRDGKNAVSPLIVLAEHLEKFSKSYHREGEHRQGVVASWSWGDGAVNPARLKPPEFTEQVTKEWATEDLQTVPLRIQHTTYQYMHVRKLEKKYLQWLEETVPPTHTEFGMMSVSL